MASGVHQPDHAPSGKVCIRCGQDCSNRPRTKDAQGRYTCNSCAAAASATTPGASPVRPPLPADEAPIALEPEALEAPVPSPASAARAPRAPRAKTAPCPGCGAALEEGAVLCVACGLDTRTGQSVGKARVLKARKVTGDACPHCGGAITDLKRNICPTCAKPFSVKDVERARRERESAKGFVKMYLGATLMLVCGLIVAGACAISLMGPEHAAEALIALAIIFAAKCVVAMMTYSICCSLWMGFESSLGLSFLQLSGVMAVSEAMRWGLCYFMGLTFLPFGLQAMVWIATSLIMVPAMDLDIDDALLAGPLIALAAMFAPILLALMGALG